MYSVDFKVSSELDKQRTDFAPITISHLVCDINSIGSLDFLEVSPEQRGWLTTVRSFSAEVLPYLNHQPHSTPLSITISHLVCDINSIGSLDFLEVSPEQRGWRTAVSQSSASLYTSLNYSRHDRLIVQFTLNHMPIPGLHVSLALSDSRKKLVRHDHLSEVAIPGAINGRVFPCVQEKAKKQKPQRSELMCLSRSRCLDKETRQCHDGRKPGRFENPVVKTTNAVVKVRYPNPNDN
ncbi:hypothetical protein J6590_058774 [Homalodisca vitripennis]|nr:hypothetical protein J6590_058774 [Homalodisca vitripennis]